MSRRSASFDASVHSLKKSFEFLHPIGNPRSRWWREEVVFGRFEARHIGAESLYLFFGLGERVGESRRRAPSGDELDEVVHARFRAVGRLC